MTDELAIAGKPYKSSLLVGVETYKDFKETRAATDAAISMELGCAGLLMNTAIAGVNSPVLMASAMEKGVEDGRDAFLAGPKAKKLYTASPSSPTTGMIR